jgi:membrane-associated phospholipid phosphatase
MTLRHTLVGWVVAACCGGACAQQAADTSSDHRRAGDVLSFALPAGVAVSVWLNDRRSPPADGERGELMQFAGSFAATLAVTEVLKRTVRSERPDGRDNLSFPSGHASRAFAAASFVHSRHGWETAWPLYAAAGYVGWTRVDSKRHRWGDVAGSLAVSSAMTWWLVDPARSNKEVSVTVAPRALSVQWVMPL